MSTLSHKFKSETNKSIVLKIIDEVAKSKYQIKLSDEFSRRIFNDIMDFVFSRFGKKPQDLSEDDYLKNINKICIDEAIKYIGENINCFPKISNTHLNNKVHVMTEARQLDPPVYSQSDHMGNNPTSLVPYNPPTYQSQQNLFRSSDDLLNQMQYDRGNYGNSAGNFGQDQGRSQPNFTLPTEISGQKPAEQALMEALEQRRKDYPSMKTPVYQSGNNETSNVGGQETNNSTLMSIILQTPIAIQNPNLVPSILNEIMQMPHLVDLMNKNPPVFQQQMKNPEFLQMIINQVQNKSNPKLKPMDLNETPVSQQSSLTPIGAEPPVNSLTSEFMKRMSAYKDGPSTSSDVDITQHMGNLENKMNKFIPPSEQLVNNVLPDLDAIHLIDYDISLDFRNDLENSAKNRYLLKFNKYGNISKIKLNSCLIPENDYLASEPYIYIKIEELGGRCYTSNNDNVFGKLILHENRNGYLYYKPDENSCVQFFSQPQTFNKFTISFVNYNGKYLSLEEIAISKALKLKKQNKLKFVTEYRHKLNQNEEIEIHIYRKTEIDSYTVQVDSIIDEHTFTVDNVFEVLTEKIKIRKNSFNCCLGFKFYEINWNLLTQKNTANAQLIRLSQLVNESRQKKLENTLNSEKAIIEHVKSNFPLPAPIASTQMTQSGNLYVANPMAEQLMKMYNMPNLQYGQ